MSTRTDYDIHGLVGIRLEDASPRDAAAVGAQLGMTPGALAREPDITIRFVDELPLSGPMRLLGLDDAAFTRDAFLVLRGRHKSKVRVQIPFERIGGPCEILCERGVAEVPLLIPLLNLTVLGRGALALHASAFRFNGAGVVATGWSESGKTETLLAFMAHGAAYVADDWVYIDAEGSRMFGVPEPIHVWDWHLESLPQYRAAISRRDRARMRMLGVLARGLGKATAGGTPPRSAAGRTINRVAHMLGNQLCVDVTPQQLFGGGKCEYTGTPDRIFFTASQDAPQVTVSPIAPQEVARRMVFSLQQEQQELFSYYLKFRFAFPDRSNELIEQSRQKQHDALVRVLQHKQVFEVRHPYHVELVALYDALRPYCT